MEKPVRPKDELIDEFNCGVCGGFEEEISEEALGSKGYNKPYQPSALEREEHERTHLPYRDWCPHCVRGRAKGDQHRQTKDEVESEVPKISLDYMYLHEKHPDLRRPANAEGR